MPAAEPRGFFVRRAGLLTTVQDLGRYGYQRYGVSICGAMDRTALRLANRLLGNPDGAAGLEITLHGPELEFDGTSTIAVTGADLSPALNGSPISMWTALRVRAGDSLRFGARRAGARAYIAFHGGIDVPHVLGSRSTHLRSGIGGLEGRAVKAGDHLWTIVSPEPDRQSSASRIPESLLPLYEPSRRLRVILGPQAEWFRADSISLFLAHRYTVSPHSDRIGFRLTGPGLFHKGLRNMPSAATTIGSIQVPPDRQPILLMADCQTTGGYPNLATLISADQSFAAQLAPGDSVGFASVSREKALRLCRMQRAELDRLFPAVG